MVEIREDLSRYVGTGWTTPTVKEMPRPKGQVGSPPPPLEDYSRTLIHESDAVREVGTGVAVALLYTGFKAIQHEDRGHRVRASLWRIPGHVAQGLGVI